MPKRTVDNCVILKRNMKARNEDLFRGSENGKCKGISSMFDDDDVIQICKVCSIYEEDMN